MKRALACVVGVLAMGMSFSKLDGLSVARSARADDDRKDRERHDRDTCDRDHGDDDDDDEGPDACAAFHGEQHGQCDAWVDQHCSALSPLPRSCAHHLAEFQEDCTARSACPAGVALACVDLQTDANNCGSCGNVCSGACTNGACGPPACNAPGTSSFTDNFNRADGPLGNPYLTPLFATGSNASIVAQQACAGDHGAALVQINTPANSVTVDFDWTGTAANALENLAVAADECGSIAVAAGTDGGQTPPKMQIQFIGSSTKVEGDTIIPVVPGLAYHLSATFDPNGNVSVQLTTGTTLVGALSTSLGMSIAYHQAGAIIGRVAGQDTCIDNLSVQVH